MELSAIAIKALISFSLGLTANTAQRSVLGDTITSKKNTTTVNAKKSKKADSKDRKSCNFMSKNKPAQAQLDSCNKCGKG